MQFNQFQEKYFQQQNLQSQPTKVILCIPGNNFSREFVLKLVDFVNVAPALNIQLRLSMQYDAVVHYARTKCLGADVRRGIHQLPFDNKLDYDYIMWIDSDIMFQPQQVKQIIQHLEDDSSKEVISGWYSMIDGINTTMVEKMDNDFFIQNGYYRFTKNEEMMKYQELIKCDYIGMGFMAMKRSIFQKINYPWFASDLVQIGPEVCDMSSEDATFCKKLNQAGIHIWVDPKCRVGHQKMLIL